MWKQICRAYSGALQQGLAASSSTFNWLRDATSRLRPRQLFAAYNSSRLVRLDNPEALHTLPAQCCTSRVVWRIHQGTLETCAAPKVLEF
jgi:hypothetical protein